MPHECPACTEPLEDNEHVIQCPAGSRRSWRADTIQKVQEFQPTKSDPYLIDIMQDGLLRYHQRLPPIPEANYPTQYQTLIATQTAIGWKHLYKGRWSREWSHLQTLYLQNKDPTAGTTDGQSWVLAVGRLLINQWLQVWKIRNQERHGTDELQQKQIRMEVACAELKELYTYKTKVCPADRSIFHDTADEHLANHSIEGIETWITTYRNAIKASIDQATRLGITDNRTLFDYPMFNPVGRAPHPG
jgi:hypothetical protein